MEDVSAMISRITSIHEVGYLQLEVLLRFSEGCDQNS